MPKLKNELNSLRSAMASAAQGIIDAWEQDEEGFDEELGSGGVCDSIAMAIIDIIQSNVDAEAVCAAPEGEDHEWVAVSNGQEACIVDIPSHIYEQGGGYSWKKIPDAIINPQDILIIDVPPKEVSELFESNYADDALFNMPSDGMTDDLWQLARDDAKIFGKLNIGNNKERNIYLYLDNFYDDLCEEFGYKLDMRDEILELAFDKLRHNDKVELIDIRKAVYSAIRELSTNHKLAYPSGFGMDIRKPSHDVSKWVEALNAVQAAIQRGESRYETIKKITEGWSPMEKVDFEAWIRYYAEGNQTKYASYKVAFPFTPQEEVVLTDEVVSPDARGPGRPRRKMKTPEDVKLALVSRLDSADKLLREFAQVWPSNVWNRLHASLNDLKREVMMLRSASTMRDVIIKTAGLWAKDGFNEGAELLQKIAQPPEGEGDVAGEIERALSGTEKEKKPEAAPEMTMPEMPETTEEMNLSPEEMGAVPPAGAGEQLPMPEPPLGAEEPTQVPTDTAMVPAVPEKQVPEMIEMPEEPKSDINVEENPYAGSTIRDVVEVLEPVVLDLKERATARELAKIDMMLDAQGIASHFPELGEAMNKILEANTYVVTRLDKLLTKIKGGAQEKAEQKEEEPSVGPEIDMGELTNPQPQEIPALEVSETPAQMPQEAPPAAPEMPALEVAETPGKMPAGEQTPLGKR